MSIRVKATGRLDRVCTSVVPTYHRAGAKHKHRLVQSIHPSLARHRTGSRLARAAVASAPSSSAPGYLARRKQRIGRGSAAAEQGAPRVGARGPISSARATRGRAPNKRNDANDASASSSGQAAVTAASTVMNREHLSSLAFQCHYSMRACVDAGRQVVNEAPGD